jgi:hypothetical protein
MTLGWQDFEVCGEHSVIGDVSVLLSRIDFGVGKVQYQHNE